MAASTKIGREADEQRPRTGFNEEEQGRHHDEDDEFFELDVEVLNSIPVHSYYEHHATTREALLANCLLPINYVSKAIPTDRSPCIRPPPKRSVIHRESPIGSHQGMLE
ncbi:hypothetical protein COCNU_02G009800 [Cocos nucifera]|uniref:Uncharacterized protein n=1 Tax=Cocos nucifera TaxID=13894 RepID=A0A8K0MX18_COCNU|nr:hypothetical protein COCNU_02G009800 [Cocos nucifera]